MSTTKIYFETFNNDRITDTMLIEAATFFSKNYGVWGPQAAPKLGLIAGRRVKMSKKTLRTQCIPTDSENIYVRAMLEGGELVGNLFATRWTHEGENFCWIAQLVVATSFRRRTIATRLLQELLRGERGVVECTFGVLSSQPATIMACLRAFGAGLEEVDLRVTRDWARSVMDSCPVRYVREARLHGSLFRGENVAAAADDDGAVSCAFTDFRVAHEEMLEVLRNVGDRGLAWPFGVLLEGCEFLVLVKHEGGLDQ